MSAGVLADRSGEPLRVGVIGHGAIGRRVIDALRRGEVAGATLAGVVTRTSEVPQRVADPSVLAAACGLVVEVAGHEALREHGASVLEAGADLLTVSAGALSDPRLRGRLLGAGPGRLWLCPGGIGGLDLVRAVRRAGPGTTVRLTSTKAPGTLIRPWMDDALRDRLSGLTEGEIVVFDGAAAEAASRFPANANVAATLALAVGDWDAVRVRLIADPAAQLTEHRIEIDSAVGMYSLVVRNEVLPDNPASSRLVGHAVLRAIGDLAGAGPLGFI